MVKGVVYDVCSDAYEIMEWGLDVLPAEFAALEGPLEFGMQRLLDVMEWAGK